MSVITGFEDFIVPINENPDLTHQNNPQFDKKILGIVKYKKWGYVCK